MKDINLILPFLPEKRPKLTQIHREVLVGILLGNACLETFSNGKGYRLREQHKEYLFHLYEIFKNLTLSPPKQYIWSDSRNPGKQYKRWSFSTTQQVCFRFYGQQFYAGEEKKKTKLIDRWLKGRSIAYWYMDDGAQKWKGRSLVFRFCTDNFKNREVRAGFTKQVHSKNIFAEKGERMAALH